VRAVASLGGQPPISSPPVRTAQPAMPSWGEPTRRGSTRPAETAPLLPGMPGFESTDSVRKVPPRRRSLLPIIIVFVLIGVGVALGVAFSGPELDVVDPVPAQAAPKAGK
jgi:hypothetical protein